MTSPGLGRNSTGRTPPTADRPLTGMITGTNTIIDTARQRHQPT